LVASSEIDPAELNVLQCDRPQVEHVYTSPLCRELVLWTWTRGSDQVRFDEAAHRRILQLATELCGDFSDTIPIVDRGSMRYKLARLSAAVAARTFSREDDDLVVRACHVDFTFRTLRRVYNGDVFGYRGFTDAVKAQQTLAHPKDLLKYVNTLSFPRHFVTQILEANLVDLQDLQDWCAFDRSEAQHLLSTLVRHRALRRTDRRYRKTPAFIEMLKHSLSNGGIVDRPDFIKEEF
jgi:hypothetical protein